MYYRVENEIRLKLFFFDEMLNLLIIMEKNSYVQNESRNSKNFALCLCPYPIWASNHRCISLVNPLFS